MPEEEQLQALRNLGKKEQAIFIKLEPNISQKIGNPSAHQDIKQFLSQNQAVPGRPLFTKYSFILDLSSSEEQLFNQLDSKTRYNVKLASKKGVQIFENSSEAGIEEYIKILEETTKRQGFYAHTPDYFRKMWQIMGQSGILHIFNAVYEKQILVSWIVFVFNGVLYYPYGASRREHREVMASNLMMWEMIRFGQKMNCHKFDMWGALGPEPDEQDPWFGFHKFKKGYGGDLHEFLGTYDLVLAPIWYQLFINLKKEWEEHAGHRSMNKFRSLVNYLNEKKLVLAAAESCTAGKIMATLAQYGDCGECLFVGYVVYNEVAKKKLLGVKDSTIAEYTLTSEKVAQEMVQGVFQHEEINTAIATTGIT